MYSEMYIYPQTFSRFLKTSLILLQFFLSLYSFVSKMETSINCVLTSVNCILLGDYSLRDTFTVNVCELNLIVTAQIPYNESSAKGRRRYAPSPCKAGSFGLSPKYL